MLHAIDYQARKSRTKTILSGRPPENHIQPLPYRYYDTPLSHLNRETPEAIVELHSADAEALGVGEGVPVQGVLGEPF